jgi:hypothetical protein
MGTVGAFHDTMGNASMGFSRETTGSGQLMRVESGPAKWDYYRYLIMTLVFFGWWAYCYYDGTWGWVNKNRAEARKQLAPIVAGAREIPEALGSSPTSAEFESIRDARPEVAELHKRFGAPFHSTAGQSGETIDYYVSDYGMIKVTTKLNRVKPGGLEWTLWYKPKSEIGQQHYWGLAGLIVAAITGYYFVRAARFRLVVDEKGLTCEGRFIPFESMTGFTNYSRKGWVDLNHGAPKALRLDNQRLAKFDETIDAICEAKGFPDPRRELAEDTEPSASLTEPPPADPGGDA